MSMSLPVITIFIIMFVFQPVEAQTSPIQFNLNFRVSGLIVFLQGGIIDNAHYTSATTKWNWGDGTSTTSQGGLSLPQHIYSYAGQYTITVTVTDNLGNTNTFVQNVTVSSPIGMNINLQINGLTVIPLGEINDTTSNVKNIFIEWNWGDGTISNGWPSITQDSSHILAHAYPSAGRYKITVTASDNLGQTNTFTQTVILKSPSTIPEFGPVALAVLVISIMSTIIISARTRLIFSGF
jgi:predicted secreted protein with PEFG-CTERM motif